MGPTRPRPPALWAPVRLLAAYGLGVVLIAVPADALGASGGVDLSSRSLVAVVAVAGTGDGASSGSSGFVLDRDGRVVRVGTDGSLEPTAELDHYSTPFGTSVAGWAVFGGVRCEGDGCDRRVAELVVLDGDGQVAATVPVARSSGWPSPLNGMALVGPNDLDAAGAGGAGDVDGETVWVNAGGRLHQVAVDRPTGEARVVDDVPWPGGEPCVIDGRLHDLAASGGITGRQGAWVGDGPGGAAPPFRLVLRRWTGDRWLPLASGATTMPDGQNAYCTPGGYEIRNATTTLARWTPTTPWHLPPPTASSNLDRATPAGPGATTRPAISTGTAAASRAPTASAASPSTPGSSAANAEASPAARPTGSVRLAASGSPSDAASPDPTVAAGSVPGGLAGKDEGPLLARGEGADGEAGRALDATAGSEMPAAVLVDGYEGGAGVLRCATTYRSGVGSTRCGLEPAGDPPPGTPSTAGTAATSGAAVRAVPVEGWGGSVSDGGSVGTPWAVDHYNMCSAACGPGVRPHTRDVVAGLAERHRPAALSLNEACYDDAVHLAGRLTTMTAGAAYSALDSAVGCPGAVKRYGNLVLVDASLELGAAWWRPFRTQAVPAGEPCDHRRDECRGMVCVDAGPAGEPRTSDASRVFCSAHLESPRRDEDVAEAQAREYVTRVDARFDGRRWRVLAGDFNLERPVTDDVLGPAGYRAAGAGATVGARPSDAGDIDRIYDSAPGESSTTVTSYCDPQASDHCYMTTAVPSAAFA